MLSLTKTAKLLFRKQRSEVTETWEKPTVMILGRGCFSPWLVPLSLLQPLLGPLCPPCEWIQPSGVCSFMSWCSLRLHRGLYSQTKESGQAWEGGFWIVTRHSHHPHTPPPTPSSFLLEHHRKWRPAQTPGPTRSPALIMGKLNKRHPLLPCLLPFLKWLRSGRKKKKDAISVWLFHRVAQE